MVTSTPRKFKSFSAVLLIMGLVVASYVVWKHKRTEQLEEQAFAAKEQQLQSVIVAMTNRWNANTNWPQVFRDRLPSGVYTSELEKATIGSRPILLYASLDDIKQTGSGYTAEMSSPVTALPLKVRYNLSCDTELTQQIIGGKRGYLNLFAVVAQIERIDKRTEPASVDIDGKKDVFQESYFFATGSAKDMVFVGSRGLRLALEQSRDGVGLH